MGERICSWCGKRLGPAPDLPAGEITHGICKCCLRRVYGQAEGLKVGPERELPEAALFYVVAAVVGGAFGALAAPILTDLGLSTGPWLPAIIGAVLGVLALAAWFYLRGLRRRR